MVRKFEDSLKDIDLWINKIKEFGYQKIIIGHSLVCNKALYYLTNTTNKIDKVIFLSIPDMIGLTKKEDELFNIIVSFI